MSLFKYFEKRAKDGLPNPNDPLSSCPLDKSVGQLKGIRGLAEYLKSQQHLKERTWSIRLVNSYSYSAFYACNSS